MKDVVERSARGVWEERTARGVWGERTARANGRDRVSARRLGACVQRLSLPCNPQT